MFRLRTLVRVVPILIAVIVAFDALIALLEALLTELENFENFNSSLKLIEGIDSRVEKNINA